MASGNRSDDMGAEFARCGCVDAEFAILEKCPQTPALKRSAVSMRNGECLFLPQVSLVEFGFGGHLHIPKCSDFGCYRILPCRDDMAPGSIEMRSTQARSSFGDPNTT